MADVLTEKAQQRLATMTENKLNMWSSLALLLEPDLLTPKLERKPPYARLPLEDPQRRQTDQKATSWRERRNPERGRHNGCAGPDGGEIPGIAARILPSANGGARIRIAS